MTPSDSAHHDIRPRIESLDTIRHVAGPKAVKLGILIQTKIPSHGEAKVRMEAGAFPKLTHIAQPLRRPPLQPTHARLNSYRFS